MTENPSNFQSPTLKCQSTTVEEMFAIDEAAQRAPDQIEIRVCGLVNCIFAFRHSGISMRLAPLLTKG